MDRQQVRAALLERGVYEGSFSIGALGARDETLVLERGERDWAVYYSERGLKTGLRRFASEEEACEHFFVRLTADETAYSRPTLSRRPWWKFW